MNVINGYFRNTESENNMWASGKGAPLPQWIQLDLRQPAPVSQVRITFDSGLFRTLALTHNDYHTSEMIRAPQPETVMKYRVELIREGQRRTVAEVQENYQRQRVHRFAPSIAEAVRLTCEATNGIPEARVFEVRAYGYDE